MAKPFAVKTITSESILLRTTDGNNTVLLDENAVQNGLVIKSVNKGVLFSGNAGNTVAIQMLGGDMFLFNPGGNIIETASNLLDNGNDLQSQSMETITAKRSLLVADAVYNQLDNTDVGGINVVSRLNITPNAIGTIIHSIILNVGTDNIDGRYLWIQNIGTDPAQTITLTNQNPLGTVGGKFLGPGDYIIPAGGGCDICFDQDTDAWQIKGI